MEREAIRHYFMRQEEVDDLPTPAVECSVVLRCEGIEWNWTYHATAKDPAGIEEGMKQIAHKATITMWCRWAQDLHDGVIGLDELRKKVGITQEDVDERPSWQEKEK